MLTKQELRDYIIERFDPDEVIEVLDISTEDLLVFLLDKCHKKQHLFVEDEELLYDKED